MTVEFRKSKVLSAKTIAAFGAQAKREWNELRGYRSWFYINSKKLWTFYVEGEPICVIGLKQNTLLGTGAEIFFMLCRGFQRHAKTALKFIRRALRRVLKLYGRLIVRVDEGFWIGAKFITFFGFRENGLKTEFNGTTYLTYEMRATWL